mgnify:CR=1 FL=1
MTPEQQKRFPPAPATLKDGTTVTLRPLLPDDGERLGDFYESIPRTDIRFYCPHPLTREKARENAGKALSPCEAVLVMETAGGEIGGYAWFRWQEGAGLSHFGICVRRGFQENGAGGALMARLLELAQEIGPPVMALTVQKANTRAVALYMKMGFRIVREQMRGPMAIAGFPPEPEYYMERAATPP